MDDPLVEGWSVSWGMIAVRERFIVSFQSLIKRPNRYQITPLKFRLTLCVIFLQTYDCYPRQAISLARSVSYMHGTNSLKMWTSIYAFSGWFREIIIFCTDTIILLHMLIIFLCLKHIRSVCSAYKITVATSRAPATHKIDLYTRVLIIYT